MKLYVSDAVAFLHYLLDDLPPGASTAFKEAEEGNALICLPTIAAAELYYLFKKKRKRQFWSKLKAEMEKEGDSSFQYYPFDERVLSFFEKTKALEIHDQIIVSTARASKCDALITKDEQITRLREMRTLW